MIIDTIINLKIHRDPDLITDILFVAKSFIIFFLLFVHVLIIFKEILDNRFFNNLKFYL
jgi:hypothetical protein